MCIANPSDTSISISINSSGGSDSNNGSIYLESGTTARAKKLLAKSCIDWR